MPYLKDSLCDADFVTKCSTRKPAFTCRHYRESRHSPLVCAYKHDSDCYCPDAIREAKRQLVIDFKRQHEIVHVPV